MEKVLCNLCGNKKNVTLFSSVRCWEFPRETFTVVYCPTCSLCFLSPRPRTEKIGKYYLSESYWGRDMKDSKNITVDAQERDETYGPIYSLILSKKKKGTILDIGAGIGLFLSKFKELGWKILGVELSPDTVKFAKSAYGVTLTQGDFMDMKVAPESIDIITMNNSLEHLYNPLETLKKVHHTLKQSGAVIITVPNIESLGAMIFQKDWYPLKPPVHLYHFSPRTLSALLDKAGFEVVQISHSYWIHAYYSIFESIRFKLSPRFQQQEASIKQSQVSEQMTHTSVKKILGILGAKILTDILVTLGTFFKKGEVIIIYARKK